MASPARRWSPQQLLTEGPERATAIGERTFPSERVALIAGLVLGDVPYYEPKVPQRAIAGVNRAAWEWGCS